ncbi:MAG: AraC family transcriptional regulator [Candidatus Firestonebacteria bacterium]
MNTLKVKDWIKNKNFPFKIEKNPINTNYKYHNHEFFEFFFVYEGKFSHNLNGEERIVSRGDIVLMNPGYKHSFKRMGVPAETIQAIFTPSFLDVDTNLLKKFTGLVELIYLEPFYNEGFKIFRLTGGKEFKVRSLLFEMLYEYEKKPVGFQITLKAKLLELLIMLVRFYENEKNKTPEKKILSKKAAAITESLFYIDNHFKEPLRLEEISRNKAGLTKEYYCTVFKKITGRTFTEYITQLRIEEAKRLLLNENISIGDVCYESGFNDLSHFTRTFKLLTGKNPTKYRKTNKARL